MTSGLMGGYAGAPICTCGHTAGEHSVRSRACMMTDDVFFEQRRCPCAEYVNDPEAT